MTFMSNGTIGERKSAYAAIKEVVQDILPRSDGTLVNHKSWYGNFVDGWRDFRPKCTTSRHRCELATVLTRV